MKKIRDIGECPKCGDSLTLYSASTGSRLVMCNDIECHFSYPVPRSGSIVVTGGTCPEHELPILFINRPAHKSKYCWVREPCFACRKARTCERYLDLVDEFDIRSPEEMYRKKATPEQAAEE